MCLRKAFLSSKQCLVKRCWDRCRSTLPADSVQLAWPRGLRSGYLCYLRDGPVNPCLAASCPAAAWGLCRARRLVNPCLLLGFVHIWHHWQPITRCFGAEFKSYFIIYLYSVQIFWASSSIHFVAESVCQYSLKKKRYENNMLALRCLFLFFFCNVAGWWNAVESIAGVLESSYRGNDFLPPAAVML